MTERIKSSLDKKTGYIAFPRSLAASITKNMPINTTASLYFYLLYIASYNTVKSKYGLLKRGETDITLKEIALNTHTEYSKIRRLSKRLVEEELLIYKQIGCHRRITLPYYEDHCGHTLHQQEQPDGTVNGLNKTDKDFALFWEFYHEMIQVPPQDREKARKIYGKLSVADRETAIRNVEVYYNSLDSERHAKWAVNYLKDKSFIMSQK